MHLESAGSEVIDHQMHEHKNVWLNPQILKSASDELKVRGNTLNAAI